ncbi:hypothetical protein AB0B48_08880 [Micromonospora sp. NPDC049089]|uniref:hypothetical protein n=1 Tax=Micromonospora sp. NPDC049089 TaxID=3155496 RepID=UPI0033EE64F9
MIRTRLTAATLTLAVAVTTAGCSGDAEPAAAPSATPTSASPTPAPTTASPTPAASPSADPDVPLKLGKSRQSPDGAVVSTVYAYKQPVAKTAPRPDEQKGYEWGAVDVKVCVNKHYTADDITVSNSPWVLVYADDTQIEASSTGYDSFPEPEYPWGDKALAPGRCVRGWITFPVPAKKRPVAVEYAADSEPVPPRWAVK